MTDTPKTPATTASRAGGPMLAVLLSAMFMGQFDFSAVNVAAPSLERDLAAGSAALEYIVGGYAFAYAGGLITGGRLGDLFGHRRVFVVGMASFVVASLLCGAAADPAQLVVARLLQGLTAALMIPQVLAVITATYPAHRRPRALAWYAVAAGLGTIAGQVIGGLLVEIDVAGLGWRVIFLINLPLGAVAVPLALRLLPRTLSAGQTGLDPLGAAGVCTALACVLVPLGVGHSQSWPAWTWVCIVAAAPVAMLTLHWQRVLARRGGTPILELSLFGHRTFVAAIAAGVAFLAYFASFMFTLALLLQRGLGLSPAEAGLTFAPMGVAFSVSSLLGPTLIARYGPRIILLGAMASAAGLGSFATGLSIHGDHINVGVIAPVVALVSLGNGIVFPSLVGAALVHVHPQQAGAAAGLLTTTQQFAMSVGVTVVGAVFFAVAGAHPAPGDYALAMRWSITIDLVLVGTVMALVRVVNAPAAGRTASPVRAPRGGRA